MIQLFKGIFIMDPYFYENTYGISERDDIAKLVNIYAPLYTKASIVENLDELNEADFIFSGWYPPKMDEAFLAHAPNLKAVFYAGGSIRPIVTDAFWDRGIRISSAFALNAIPVSEYALSQILFCLKRGWYFVRTVKEGIQVSMEEPIPGTYHSVVGIVSLGQIGRRVCKLLRSFDVDVIAYDPFISKETADELNVTLCTLEELFSKSDVVSLHTPVLKETEGLITGNHIASMKLHASLINTSKREIVREEEMIDVLKQRKDLQVFIDGHPGNIYSLSMLPNVILTPYAAGARDKECRRLGRFMTEELQRYIQGEPLQGEITRKQAVNLA
jgi:phosphoglycerate dehydrogenase-like enzyme